MATRLGRIKVTKRFPPHQVPWTGAAACLILIAMGLAMARPAHAAEPPVDFAQQVAPIFERHCLRCHSSENKDGDISLSRFADLQETESVIAGDPEASYLLDLLTAAEGERPEMPKDGEPLADEQVELVRRWIRDGAEWPAGLELEAAKIADRQWWSLRKISRPDVPAPDAAHPIDAFLDAKLSEQNLAPVKQADPRTLIRRLTYDLTGLPPTPAEIDQFLTASEAHPDAAWENLVDRLIDSPAFGEKFGQHWLDLARYAETHGYDKDKPRTAAWPYRDYVIRSFNEDKPYARFVQEQIAGDVLFPDEPDGVVGLGFLAAGPWDFIGHWEVGEQKLDGRIAKHFDRDEMVSAVFNVFMSTTVQCAQCHDHKFDPIRMEDYYRLHAVFAAVDRADRVYKGLPADQEKAKQSLVARIKMLTEEQETLSTDINQQLATKASHIDRRITELKETYGSTLQPQYGYHSQIAQDPGEVKWVQVDLGKPLSLAEVRLFPAFDQYADIGAGFGFPARYRIEASNDATFRDESVRMLLDASAEDQPNPKSRMVAVDVGGDPVRYLRVTATKLAERQNDFILALGEFEAVEAAGNNIALGADVTALDSIESGERWGVQNLTDGIFHRELDDADALKELRALEKKRAAIERGIRTPEILARLEEIGRERKTLNAKLEDFPDAKTVYAAATHFPGGGQFKATEGKPRAIHLMHRGDLRSPGERMLPGAPSLWDSSTGESVQEAGEFFPENDWDEGEARAALAGYLTDRDNPLVWRSMANRLWQWIFRNPLVQTPNDFGRMGMQPTHPELLDYLASRLRDDPDQSLKSIVRLLVTSKAYRRASLHDQSNAEIDAGNAYLWRAHRRRLTAEEFRDSLLAVSGALRLEERGGPSFQDFVIEKPQHSPHYQYELHEPEDPAAHRRTIYRFVVRSQPQPMLTAMDCADPSISVPRRDESTTALQALTQWNNRLVEAMARRFAERLREEGPRETEARVDFACRLALGRLPKATERTILIPLLRSHGEATLARVLMNTSSFTYVD